MKNFIKSKVSQKILKSLILRIEAIFQKLLFSYLFNLNI
jgi:hypothetical protein